MRPSGERYFPRPEAVAFGPYEPFISYEHWHRYCYALPLVAGKAVLDIASGEGYGSAFLATRADLVYGVDLSEEAIQHARATYHRDNLLYLQGAAQAIPLPGEHRFDVIVSFETLEHLDAASQERFAAEITRLLKPDGVLLISTPNRETYSKDGIQGNPYHLHEFSRDELVTFLRRWFAHVRLLSQHVYPTSYIWNLNGPRGPILEYLIRLEEGKFRPEAVDTKEIGYLLAVCAQHEPPTVRPDSLLLDLSEVAFRAVPRLEHWRTTSLFRDTGAGFRSEDMIQQETEYTPEFSLEFALDPSTPVRQLRWDPLETRLCRVRLRQVRWQDGDGLISQLDLARVSSNGRQLGEGLFDFETHDPVIYLPISGPVARLTLLGECQAASLSETLDGLERAMRSRAQELARQDHDLRTVRVRLAVQEQAAEATRLRMDRQLEDKERDLARTIGERDRAEAMLAGAFGSRSWRITAPLRTSAHLVRRARRWIRQTGIAALESLRLVTLARPVDRRIAARVVPWRARNETPGPRTDGALPTAVPPRPDSPGVDPRGWRDPELTAQRQRDQRSRAE